ncbi:Cysteine hydrolase [Borealophlyctis nickersoniae]|nr:Cysteine hydrolase [Borealophlyctis nickersoniae]
MPYRHSEPVTLDPHTTALILVDVQHDFFPGGPLPTNPPFPTPTSTTSTPPPSIFATLSALLTQFLTADAKVVATRDSHPPNHSSFKVHGGPFPPHCITATPGHGWAIPELDSLVKSNKVIVIDKGTVVEKEAFSGFEGTPHLADTLRAKGVKTVVCVGVATEYCVAATARDALKEGFDTLVVEDAIGGIGDVDTIHGVLAELAGLGAKIVVKDNLSFRKN